MTLHSIFKKCSLKNFETLESEEKNENKSNSKYECFTFCSKIFCFPSKDVWNIKFRKLLIFLFNLCHETSHETSHQTILLSLDGIDSYICFSTFFEWKVTKHQQKMKRTITGELFYEYENLDFSTSLNAEKIF